MKPKTLRFSLLATMLLVAVAGADEEQQAPPPSPEKATVKMCVVEPKKNTKACYGSRCKEYCLPQLRFCDWLLGRKCGCEGADCGPVRTKKVLVKWKVPGCDTSTCVLKEIPVNCEPLKK